MQDVLTLLLSFAVLFLVNLTDGSTSNETHLPLNNPANYSSNTSLYSLDRNVTDHPTTSMPSFTNSISNSTSKLTNFPTGRKTESSTKNPTAFSSKFPTELEISPTSVPSVLELSCRNFTDPLRKDDFKGLFRGISQIHKIETKRTPQNLAFNFVLSEEKNCVKDELFLVQRYVAVLLFYSLNGNNWFNSTSYLSSSHECDWHGLHCNKNSRLITNIWLGENDLHGSIPSEIVFLQNLEELDLEKNKIIGSIPRNINKLQKLRILDLDNNALTGSIPLSLYNIRSLDTLDLDSNGFTGTIPLKIRSLVQLKHLSLYDNSLRGTIPWTIMLLKKLEILYLDKNNFRGKISEGICRLKPFFGGILEIIVADCTNDTPVKCLCCECEW